MSSRSFDSLNVATTITHKGIPVCYGHLSYANGDASIENPFPATGLSGEDTGGSSRRVTIPEMANTNYVVFLTSETSNEPGTSPCVNTKTTTTFNITGPSEASTRNIFFMVFGELA